MSYVVKPLILNYGLLDPSQMWFQLTLLILHHPTLSPLASHQSELRTAKSSPFSKQRASLQSTLHPENLATPPFFPSLARTVSFFNF